MDAFKRDTVKDYTAWDLNCARFVRIKKTSGSGDYF